MVPVSLVTWKWTTMRSTPGRPVERVQVCQQVWLGSSPHLWHVSTRLEHSKADDSCLMMRDANKTSPRKFPCWGREVAIVNPGLCCVCLQFDMLEMDRLERQLVNLPLLQDPSSYIPDTVDLTEDSHAREYWLYCFEEALDGVLYFLSSFSFHLILSLLFLLLVFPLLCLLVFSCCSVSVICHFSGLFYLNLIWPLPLLFSQ